MNTRNIKNIMDTIAFVGMCICMSSTPQLVKWYLGSYVIYLISIWLCEDNEDSTH